MATARVLWMVGTMVMGLSLAGGLALAAESQGVNVQGQVMTGDQQQQDGDHIIYIVSSGQGTATIDGQQVPFEPGTILYIPNGKPYNIKVEEGDLNLNMQGAPGMIVNAELAGTLDLETFAFDPTPVPDDSAGTFSFSAHFCNIGHEQLTELKSVTTTLTGGNVLLNKDSGTPPGVGSAVTFPATGGFADRILAPEECVKVPYQIGHATPEPFEFFVDVVGVITPSTKIAAATFSEGTVARKTVSGWRPPAFGLLHGGGRGPAERQLQ